MSLTEPVSSIGPAGVPIDQIAILDCGAQYTKVIDRRVRELCVSTEIFPADVDPALLRAGRFSGIILSGGPHSVYEAGAPQCNPGIFELGLPVFGICYGMQLLARHFGGTVEGHARREYGETDIQVDAESPLFSGLEASQTVLMSHGDSVTQLPPGFEVIAKSPNTVAGQPDTVAAIAHRDKRIYGVQFHPEVDLTEHGQTMLDNFLKRVCGLQGNFTLEDRLEGSVRQLQETCGDRPVFVLVSGGVDSTVTAALLLKALGPEKVYAVHIDSGFMRHQESDLVCEALKALGLKHLKRINAEETFLNASTDFDGVQVGPLHRVTDPEAKRRIIGDVFFHLIDAEMKATLAEAGHDGAVEVLLAQGTLRPDLIESGNRDVSATAHKIKTHHNDVPLIQAQREKGLVIEPNRDWHKDEVRQIGRLLGLSEELVMRQPFPGPGLAIRVLCAEEAFGLEQYDAVNGQLQSLAAENGYQAVLAPVRSVGVQGDGRSYSYLALLTAPQPVDASDWPKLRELAREIPNRIRAINRVALVLNRSQLPTSIKTVTPTWLNRPTLDRLRRLDHTTTEAFKAAGCLSRISQLLTVLVPVDTAGQGRHSVAIRGVMTADFMTARPASLGRDIPWALLHTLTEQLDADPDVDLVMVDMTGKPPATVEWE